MPRFAANLNWLFTDLPMLDRFDAASQAGFEAVEYMFPFDYDINDLVEKLRSLNLIQVLFNMPPGDWEAGDRGLGCLPDRVDEFRASVQTAIDAANALNCPTVNCLSGIPASDIDPALMEQTFVENLRYATAEFAKHDVHLVIEAINTRDIPGFYLNTSAQAFDIIEKVGSDNLSLQYDIYHMQVMEGDLANTLAANLHRIGHLQLADNPGRHEPGTGEINYPFLFRHIDAIGYEGWIGCEYKPIEDTAAGLGWIKEMN
ncbi:hydroxypyruvate isomerase [Pararhizobium sp. IMCC21322]|uniref:hydroxypyruvate isomerase n=1 Tax=Pararhizobium sp. IMCC21322 TaxID=3067903 RepID=UPI00274091CC|nr:hydroxypyruvate isomerase [Pararhizobium sp. IMCC21322]